MENQWEGDSESLLDVLRLLLVGGIGLHGGCGLMFTFTVQKEERTITSS